ncbi:MAG TPA: type III-A CRISPR-associated RAMP protein Csm5, partial [Candidatus Eremiobacteraeota bacterium]|nr:type III-A CRISPR-associated RAMP protein Csm5 [Candidatus Eremiobacteraeota bacterium]
FYETLKENCNPHGNYYKYIITCKYNPQEILPHIKSIYYEPYITGSSIKGAIRTSLLKELLLLHDQRTLSTEKLKKIFKKLSNQPGERKKLISQASSDIGGDIERSIFNGKYGYNAMRALQISDTNSINYNSLNISEIRVLSLNMRNSVDWKKFKLYIETLKPSDDFHKTDKNENIHGTIKIDNYLLEDSPAQRERLGYTEEKNIIKNFIQLCNKYSLERINREINFFIDCDIREIADWYKKLKNLNLKENEFLIQIGWGTGYECKTVAPSFTQELENIRRYFGIGKKKVRIHISCDGEVLPSFNKKDSYFCTKCRIDRITREETIVIPFPKTRRIVFVDDKPAYPPGWVIISVERINREM